VWNACGNPQGNRMLLSTKASPFPKSHVEDFSMFSRAYRRPPPRRRLRQASAACETPAGNLRLQGYLAQGKPPFTGVPCSSGCRSSHEPNEPKYGLWVVRWTGRTALSDLTHSTKAFRSSELATSGRCCAPPPSPATTRAPRQVLFEDQRRSDVFSMFPIFEIYGGGGVIKCRADRERRAR